jgi:hypothetical protein
MPTARPDIANIASGADLWAGADDPLAWLPAVGERSNINANSASEVNHDLISGIPLASRWWNGYGGGNSFSSMVSSYSGSMFAREYSDAGAFLVHGGGHGGNIGQITYIFDFTDRLWKEVGASVNLPPDSHWCGYPNARSSTRDELLELRDEAWMDYLYGSSYIKLADHEYVQNTYLSPAEGGGPKGSLLLPQATFSQDPGVADPRTGTAHRWAPHVMDLLTGLMSRAAAAPHGAWLPSFVYTSRTACKDATRRKLWYFRQGVVTANYYDLSSGPPFTLQSHNLQKISGGNVTFVQATNTYFICVPEADAMLGFIPQRANEGMPAVSNGTLSVKVYGLSSGSPVDLERGSAIGTYPIQHGGFFIGAAWAPASVVGGVGKLYLYEGLGQTFCYTLTPSSLDFATCTWTWGKESFGGVSPVTANPTPNLSDAQRQGVQGKLQWVDAYGCLAWHDGPNTSGVCADGVTRNGIVQLWRPPGTPI